MSFKVFDYRCPECGVLEDYFVRSSEADNQICPDCGSSMVRLVAAPKLDIEGMARAGCPGAYETVGDRLTKQHRSVDQAHRKASKGD